MKNILLVILILPFFSYSQQTENVVLITLDGLRWQEVFYGADSALLFDKKYTENIDKTEKRFWNPEAISRRKMLMPFIWSKIQESGQIYGNRHLDSKVDIKNIYGFSYPGYNEILTGYPDDGINSNAKNYNENITFLEFMNQKADFKDRVAAFCTWDVFPFIINDKRNGIHVSAGSKALTLTGSQKEEQLNEILKNVPSLASNRFDFLTYYLAKDYLQEKRPRLLFLSFDETDEFAHEEKYREYLYAANSIDSYIADLWNYCQSSLQYKDKTTFIITTDHGRGDVQKSQWTSHGQMVKECSSIWLAAIGPDTPALGEIKSSIQLYQNQIASTIVKLLGEKLEIGKPIGEPIQSLLK